MYEQIEKPKENKSRAVANSFTRMGGKGKKIGSFQDNRSKKSSTVQLLNQKLEGVVQCAWIGRRPLAIPLSSSGLNDNQHPKGHGVFHEHIFFSDGQSPANVGFHDEEVTIFEETDKTKLEQYKMHNMGFDDAKMRIAVAMNQSPGAYSLNSNNCQHWVEKVLSTYRELEQEAPEGARTGLLSGEKSQKAYY